MQKTTRLQRLIFSVAIAIELSSPAALCQVESSGSTPTPDPSSTAAAPVALDFSSTDRTMTNAKVTTAVNIQVGQSTVEVTNSTLLTPGEYAAAMQVLHTGQQSVILGDLGNAIGGQLNLTKISSPISNLVIPQGVTAINNFGLTSGALSISGNLINSGTLYAVSTVSQFNTANIFATNITNLQSGLITSVLPQAGLAGFTGAISNLNLNLNAVNDIVNAGSITSAGSLAAIAGASMINSSSAATMQAMQNINLQALNIFNAGSIIAQSGALNVATSNLVNSSLMAAQQGRVEISSLIGNTLNINNTLGTIAALNDITFQTAPSLAGSLATLDVRGGSLLATDINMVADNGLITVNTGNITGNFNTFAGEVHVATDGDLLTLGNICVTGDPTFYNTGNISINGVVSVAQNLAIIARGNITATAAATSITARDGAGQGYNIVLASGANVSGTSSTTTVPGTAATGNVTISLASPLGGNIDLSGSPNMVISANSTAGNLSGGNVTMAAFASGVTGGRIVLPYGSIINTSGSGTGNNGNVDLIAGATTATGITTGQIIANGGSGAAVGTGQINITTAQPTTTNGASIIFSTAGAVTSGNALTAGITIQPTAVTIQSSMAAVNGITIRSGGDITSTIFNGAPVFFSGGGTNPGATAINSTSTRAYVGNYGSNNVSVFNLATNAVIANVPVGTGPSGLVINPAGTFVYVINATTNNVSVISTASNMVTATIAVGNLPQGIAINPAGTEIYVPNYNANTVSVISTATNTVTNTINMVSGSPTNVAFTPDGAYAYVTNNTGNNVSVIDTATATVVSTIPVGTNPVFVAINSAGTYAYITNKGTNNVSVININANAVVATVAVGTGPMGVSLNPAGTFAYVANQTSNNVSVINTMSNAVVATWAVGLAPIAATIDPSGLVAYVSNSSSPLAQGMSYIDLSGIISSNSTITLTTTSAGSIGSSTAPVATAGASLAINAVGAGEDVYVAQTQAVNLLGSSSADLFNLIISGTLTVANPLSSTTGAIILNAPTVINNSTITTASASATPINVLYAADLTFDGPGTYNAPVGGTVTFNTTSTAGQVTIPGTAAVVVNNGSGILIQASQLNLNNGGTLTGAGASAISINTGGSANSLTISAATGATTDFITTTGGTIGITPTAGQSLIFAQSGVGAATINLTGGVVTTTTSGAGSTIVNSGVTLLANSNLTINANASTITNDGTIQASNAAGTIVLQSTGAIAVGGTGNITQSGGGAAIIRVQAGGANALAFTGSQTFNSGAAGSIVFNAQATGASISVAANATETVASGSPITFSTPSIQFLGNASAIAASGASAITLNSGGGANGITISGATGTTNNTISTTGTIVVTPTAGQALTFAQSGAGTATINLLGSTVTTTTSGAGNTVVNSGVTLMTSSALTINANGSTITNNGTIQSSKPAATISLRSTSGLTIGGTGNVTESGGGAAAIIVLAAGVNVLTFTGSQTFNPGSAGSTYFASQTAGGSVAISANTTETIVAGTMVVNTPSMRFLGTAASIVALSASNIFMDSGGGANGVTITAATGTTNATISTNGGSFGISPTAGQSLTFAQSGAGTATINLNGGTVSTATSGAGITIINSGVTLASNSNMVLNMNNTTLTNNGTIQSTNAGGFIVIQSTSALTVTGTGSVVKSGGGAAAIVVQANGANVLAFTGLQTFNAGAAGSVVFNAQATGASITVAAGIVETVASGSALTVSTPSLQLLGSAANLAASGASSIGLNSGGGANGLTITTVTGITNNTISTTGGTIAITPTAGRTLIFAQSGAGTTTLNLNGGVVTTTTSGAGNTIVNSGVTVLTNSNMTMNANGAALINNGTIQSSNAGGSVVLRSSGAFALQGTGNVLASGGGAATVTVQAGGANALAFTTAQTFNAGAAGTVNFNAQTTGGSITIAAGITETVAGGSALVISTPSLQLLGSAANIAVSGASTITLNSGGGANGLTITSATGTTDATIATTGGTISITPTAGQALTFAQSGAGTSTINFNGGAVTTTADSTTINSGVTVSSDNTLTLNATGFVNDGTLRTTTNGAITVASTQFDSDSGVISAGSGTITLRPNTSVPVTVGSASQGAGFDVTSNALANFTAGTLVVGTVGQTGGLTIVNNLDVSGAGPAGAYNLTFNNGGSYTGTGKTITLGAKNLTVTAQSGGVGDSLSSGSVTGTTGTISLTSGGALNVDGALTDAQISLATTAGNINIYNNVTGTTTVNLTAGGAGNVLMYRATPVAVSTGANAPGLLVFNTAGTTAYSVDAANGNLLVINPLTNAVTSTIAIGSSPEYLAVDSVHSRAYVTKTGSNIVSVVNLGTNAVVGTIALSARANGIVVSPAGTKIFVATGENMVTVVATADYNTYVPGAPIVVDVNATGVGTQNLALDSSGAYLYIGNQTAQRISIMNVATNAIIAGTGGSTGALLVGSRPLGMASNGGFIYVANYLSHDVYTINTATQTVSSQNGVTGISVGATSTPVSIATSANGTTAYSANQTTNTVSVINLSTYQTVDTITLASAPSGITMSPDGTFAYVSSASGSSLTKITMPPLVTGGTVNMTSASGNIGSVAIPIRVAAPTITVNTGGNAYIEQVGNVSVGASTVTGLFQLAGSGTLTNTGLVTAGSLNWMTNNNDITLGANFSVANAASFAAVGSGNIYRTAGALTAGSVNLFSNTGNIGTVANPITTVTGSLRANTSGAGNVFLSNTGNVTLLDSTAGGSFTLTNSVGTIITIAGRVVVPNTVGHNITIQTTGSNAANRINVQAKVLAGGTVTLTATGGTVSYLPQTGVSTQLSATVAGVPNAAAIALNSAGTFAYVTDSVNWPPTSGNVRVIDTSTNLVVATIAVGNNPEGVAITPDGNYLFVTNRFSDSVSVIDLQAGGTFRQVVATISLPAGSEPWGIAFNPAGASTQAYVTNAGTSTVSVLNWQTRTVTATITGLPVGVYASYPKGVAFNPAGTAAYVADQFNRAVTVINTGTNAITTNISVGDGPFGIATGNVGGTPFAYVSNVSDNTVSVINLLTNTVVSTVNVGNNPIGISLSPTGTFAYVVNQGSNSVSVINTSTNAVVATVPVGALPKGMGNFVGTVGGNVRAYVPNTSGTVSVLDPTPALVDPYLVVLNAANIGTALDPIGILTQHLEINATGDVYAKISGSTIIDTSSVTGVLNIRADGNITTGGDISAGSVMLKTPLSLLVGNITTTNGDISLNGRAVNVISQAQITANNGNVYVQSSSGAISVNNATVSYTGGVLQSLVTTKTSVGGNTSVIATTASPVLDTGALPTSFASSAKLWVGGGPLLTASALSAIDALSGMAGRAYSNTSTTATAVTGGAVSQNNAAPVIDTDSSSSSVPKQAALSGGIVSSLVMIDANASSDSTMKGGLRSTAVRANESTLAAVVKDAGADFTVCDQLIRLNNGDILVSCLKAVTVQSGRHTVQLSKGAVALVRVVGDRLYVANLFDRKDGGISLLINNNRSLAVALGEEVIIGSSVNDMTNAIDDGIARRSVKTVDVQDVSLVSSQISYMSVLQKSPLMQLVHFDDDSSSRSISTKVEKAAACLMQLTTAKGPYKTLH